MLLIVLFTSDNCRPEGRVTSSVIVLFCLLPLITADQKDGLPYKAEVLLFNKNKIK